MKILAIETTCDETSVAIVENGTTVLSNVVASSMDLHAKTGGVIPEQAARAQIEYMIPVLKQALEEAFDTKTTDYKLLITKIDAIAVAVGPGLIGSLLVGVETAKTIAFVTAKPIIPVNHLVAHVYANWIADGKLHTTAHSLQDKDPSAIRHKPLAPQFPALCLVVSGGHTDLVYMKNHGQLEWIGGTRDDAAGEAFDKTARLLGLPYPGGVHLSKIADEYISQKLNAKNQMLNLFPRPMIDEQNFDWSFSGLKTAVLRKTQETNNKTQNDELAAQIQEAIVDVLVTKTLKAVGKYKPKSLIIGGGVSANNRLREVFVNKLSTSYPHVDFYAPTPKYSTDNAAAIASCAYFNNNPISWEKIDANPSLTIMGEE